MELKLIKAPSHVLDNPLIVMIKEPKFYQTKVKLGDTITVDEEVGYQILSQYKGYFDVAETKKTVTRKAAPKTMKAYSNKSLDDATTELT